MERDEALLRYLARMIADHGLVHLGVDARREGTRWLMVSEMNSTIAIVHDDGRIDLIPDMADAA